MMTATVPVHQLHPPPGEALEGIDLRRIDDVLHDTGDHGGSLAHAATRPYAIRRPQASSPIVNRGRPAAHRALLPGRMILGITQIGYGSGQSGERMTSISHATYVAGQQSQAGGFTSATAA
jgi:hypothetical protein